MKFDSKVLIQVSICFNAHTLKVVIPTFFVSFNLSAIVGSAILYGDFENVQVHQLTTFLYGCATTFLGVFFLTRSTGKGEAALEEAVVRPQETAEDEGREEALASEMRATRFPRSPSRRTPCVKAKNSTASLVLSAGQVRVLIIPEVSRFVDMVQQYLLLAASPPRDRIGSPIERHVRSQSIVGSPASLSRGS